jgi:hypothetical protein
MQSLGRGERDAVSAFTLLSERVDGERDATLYRRGLQTTYLSEIL